MAETATLTLTDFLLARIAEDEAHAEDAYNREGGVYIEDVDDGAGAGYNILAIGAARLLAECEAKRYLIENSPPEACAAPGDPDHRPYEDERTGALTGCGECGIPTGGPTWVKRALGLPYADHPDYDESWRP